MLWFYKIVTHKTANLMINLEFIETPTENMHFFWYYITNIHSPERYYLRNNEYIVYYIMQGQNKHWIE